MQHGLAEDKPRQPNQGPSEIQLTVESADAARALAISFCELLTECESNGVVTSTMRYALGELDRPNEKDQLELRPHQLRITYSPIPNTSNYNLRLSTNGRPALPLEARDWADSADKLEVQISG